MILSHQKYNVGEKVTALATPNVQLIVRRFVDRIYFCRPAGSPASPDLVYFERELMSSEADGGK